VCAIIVCVWAILVDLANNAKISLLVDTLLSTVTLFGGFIVVYITITKILERETNFERNRKTTER